MIDTTHCSRCCQDFDIRLEDLFFPERMSMRGREFLAAHGVDADSLAALRKDAQPLPDGQVKIQHRCAQLLDDGLCGIYEDRPAICRAFDCGTRQDCMKPQLLVERTVLHA